MATLRVREPFACDWDGTPHVFRVGDLVNDKDKVVKGRAAFFEPVEVAVLRASGVEQATAAPGEKRSRATLPKRPAAKKAAATEDVTKS